MCRNIFVIDGKERAGKWFPVEDPLASTAASHLSDLRESEVAFFRDGDKATQFNADFESNS